MADFQFRLNRQGPTGKKGEKGEKGKDGNTPIFSEGTNTATEYTLLIDYGDGNIGQTGNLRPPVTNEGGTYVRYNTQTGTYEINEADIADLNRTQGEVTLASVQDVENETALDTDAVSFELRNQDLEDINEDIQEVASDLADLSSIVTQNSEDIEALDNRLDANEDNISQAQLDIVSLDNRVTTNEGAITSLQTGKANVVHTHTVSQITDAGALASQNVVDYQSQVINKPTIPTPGDGTITITQGGVTKGTFTTNQSSNSTIELDAGGASFTAGTGLELTSQDVLNVKIDGSTITTNADGELVASGGTTLTAGDGINISNDVISVKVDNSTINFDSSGNLTANIPDVSNFVTDTQLADTLEAYPTNQALSNLVDYETITTPGQDSWVPLSLSNCRYDNTYDTDTSFAVNVSEYEVEATLSKLDPDMVTGGSQVVIGNIVFQNSSRQTAYLKTREFRFSRYTLVTDFYINGKLENGDTVQFDNTDIPSDIASYSNGILDFNVDFYVASFTVTYNFPEDYFNDFEVKIYGDTNELGGYLYNRVQGEPTVVTKAIIADTAVDGTTISINNDGQLTANIPTPVTVDQTYDATSTNAQSGVAIAGAGFLTSVPTATTSNQGIVQPDGTTITINNGVISAASSTPSNMVTTNTTQTVTGTKTFNNVNTPQLNIGNTSSGYYWTVYGGSSYADVVISNHTPSAGIRQQIYLTGPDIQFRDTEFDTPYVIASASSNRSQLSVGLRYGSNLGEIALWQYGARGGIDNTFTDNKIYRGSMNSSSSLTNFLLEKDMLDGSTLTYNSTTGKISAASSAPIRKTITQASANVSESSGTVTVTDADVTTSTIVTLYPSDTDTETWLANNLASNIITEGSGSFTFTINGTLPATFSMYYIIQEVD